MRRKDDTLERRLLEYARGIADLKGIEAINIRSLAKEAGVAAGTVYNYFSSKDEILLALTEEYWKQAVLDMQGAVTADDFCGQIEEIFLFLKERIEQSAGKLMSSLGNLEAAGQERMADRQTALEPYVVELLNQDPQIRDDIWDEAFTKEQFARFVMRNVISLLKMQPTDFRFFISLVKRSIY